MSSAPANQVVIEPSRGWASLGLKDVWEYRELLVYLVARETQGVYRQTALGLSWLFLRPVLNMLLLTFVFGRLVGVKSDDVPYPLFSLAALLPWGFFSNAVLRGSRSLVDNMHLISKVYFPRLVIPLAGAASGLVDLAAAFVVFFTTLLLYRMPLRWEMLWLPLFMLVALGFALAAGLWLATLSVKYRDVTFAVNFLLSFGADIIEQKWAFSEYLETISTLLFWMGVVFEMPLVIYFLTKLGIVNAKKLARFRRYMLVLAFVLGAFITPTPDPFNQAMVSLPIYLLFELGILLARFA